MADSNKGYLDLVTSEYATKSKFMAYVEAFLKKVSPSVECLIEFFDRFDLSKAVGDQLDKLGTLVDLTRELPVVDPDIPSSLSDDTFRLIIQARIMSNHWDGTLEGWTKIIDFAFPNASYNVVDNQDMSVNVVVIDPSATMEMIALLFNGYIVPKPSGVRVTWTIQDNPLFGWDANTNFIKGWDSGIWNSQ